MLSFAIEVIELAFFLNQWVMCVCVFFFIIIIIIIIHWDIWCLVSDRCTAI
jgi:hypothetical protein